MTGLLFTWIPVLQFSMGPTEDMFTLRTFDLSMARDSVISTLYVVKGLPTALSLQQTTAESVVRFLATT